MSDPEKEASGERPAPAADSPSSEEKRDGLWAASPEPPDAESPGAKPAGEAATVEPAAEEPAPDEPAAKEPRPDEPADDAPDLESRELCPDGACIGVIGPDGRCKVCGKRGEAPAPRPAPVAGTAPAAPAAVAADDSDDESPDLRDRRLCSDGACIGVIGPDDHCKVCGKPYTGEPEL